MFQIIFNPISAHEMSLLPKELQLDLLCEFQVLPQDLTTLPREKFGIIHRQGRELYRYRCLDYRLYFEPHHQGIIVHRVLHKNTLKDFLYRSELPELHHNEDELLAEVCDFWKLIDEGNSSQQPLHS